MEDIRTYTKEKVQERAQDIMAKLLQQNGGKTEEQIIGQIARADSWQAAFAPGKVAAIEKAISDAGITKNQTFAQTTKDQLKELKDSVVDALYASAQGAPKNLAGDALAANIAQSAEKILQADEGFTKALKYANGLTKVENPNAPDIKVSDLTTALQANLKQYVPEAVAQDQTVDKSANEGKTPPVVGKTQQTTVVANASKKNFFEGVNLAEFFAQSKKNSEMATERANKAYADYEAKHGHDVKPSEVQAQAGLPNAKSQSSSQFRA